jgi:hypothetical protein
MTMHPTMKMTLAALASLALLPTAASAVTVKAPHPGTVTVLTYSSSGSFHGAVDIASGASCNYWGVETGVVGSFYWNITINTTSNVCYLSGSGLQNEAKHVFADGHTFRLWHFNKTAQSYDRTCDRCQVGDEGGPSNFTPGPHSHLQVDKSGTRDTSWYVGYVVKGQHVDRTTTIGVF